MDEVDDVVENVVVFLVVVVVVVVISEDKVGVGNARVINWMRDLKKWK